jgi:hypothetical protein
MQLSYQRPQTTEWIYLTVRYLHAERFAFIRSRPNLADLSDTYLSEVIADLDDSVRDEDRHTYWREGLFRMQYADGRERYWQGTPNGLRDLRFDTPQVTFIDAVEA